MPSSFVVKGNICYSKSLRELETVENGYAVCEDGISAGVFRALPEKFAGLPLTDYGGRVILPGLVDLHIHAPQYAFRGAGMDLELLDWLNAYTFPEESKYSDLAYADKAYSLFVRDLLKGPSTRLAVFATAHVPATLLLMEKLEKSGLVTFVGKVNMDRNAPPGLREESAERSARDTAGWIEACGGKFKNTAPILTPRFIPACTDDLMRRLGDLQKQYRIPVQSHLSESLSEIEWVKALCPGSASYGDAYARFGLLGGDAKTIMAHCVWSPENELALLKENGVYVAHCPQANTNLASGVAPVRKYLDKGLRLGLGSDVAGGASTSIFRAMSDATQVSKLYWRLIDQNCAPLTAAEAFYLGTLGGGGFFGKTGSLDAGFEFDAIILDDSNLTGPGAPGLLERLSKIIYLSDDRNITAKYVRGKLCPQL